MRLLFKILCLISVVFYNLLAIAQDSTLREIKIEGLTRTSDYVVLRELELAPGEQVSAEDLEKAVQRVRNLGIFADVKGRIDSNGVFTVSLSERWTLIPIAKFASGGGVNQFIFGLFNSNLLGLYKEAGAQYERLGSTNSGVTWYKDPWFFGNRFGLDLQIWDINRIRTKYQLHEIDPIVKTGFLQARKKLFIGISKQVRENVEVKPFVEYHKDSFADKYLEPEVSEKVKITGLPPDTEVMFYGLNTKLGSINYNGWLQDGTQLELTGKYAVVKTEGYGNFHVYDATVRHYKTMFSDHTLALRAGVGSTNTSVLQYWNYFGGLADVRGFSDNRFAGRAFWLTNSEWRLPVVKKDWIAVQQVTFFDSVATDEYFHLLKRASGTSVGVGVRLIAPKIYRLVARIDIAKPLVRRDEMPISFGVQQFF